MTTKRLRSFFGSAVVISGLFGCASTQKSSLPPQETVPYVDLPKFMGRWYVIASIPTIFEKDATNAVEIYTWNEKKKRIDIDFTFRKEKPDGEEKKIPQVAFVHNQTTNAEWRVQPIWPLKFAYLIVDLDDDSVMVGVPDRKNVWIMSRKTSMDTSRYTQLVQKAQTLGYDITKLEMVPQVWPASTNP